MTMRAKNDNVHRLFALEDKAEALKESIQDAVWAYNAWEGNGNTQAAAATLHVALKKLRSLEIQLQAEIRAFNKSNKEEQHDGE